MWNLFVLYFGGFDPPKRRPLQIKQGSIDFQVSNNKVYIYIFFFLKKSYKKHLKFCPVFRATMKLHLLWLLLGIALISAPKRTTLDLQFRRHWKVISAIFLAACYICRYQCNSKMCRFCYVHVWFMPSLFLRA